MIPESEMQCYQPTFMPWILNPEFLRYHAKAELKTAVSTDRCYSIFALLKQSLRLGGDVAECGVYKGGTSAMMAQMLADISPLKKLFLFDTFEGMPEVDISRDDHRKGDFMDTSEDDVRQFVGNPELCSFRKGLIPESFRELDSLSFCFAHIDVDIYQSTIDCLKFIWPRLSVGGFVICDDYGFPQCRGAKDAVDEFFEGIPVVPLAIATGQAIMFKSL